MEPVPVVSKLVPAVVQRTAPAAEEVPGAVKVQPAIFLIGTREHLSFLCRIQIIKVILIFLKSGQAMSVCAIQQIPTAVKLQPAGFLIRRFLITVLADYTFLIIVFYNIVSLILNGDPAFTCKQLSFFVEVIGLFAYSTKTVLYEYSVRSSVICTPVHLNKFIYCQIRSVIFSIRRKAGNPCTVSTVCTWLSTFLGEVIRMYCTILFDGLYAGQKISGVCCCQISLIPFCKQPGLWSFRLCIIEEPLLFAFHINRIPSRLILRLLRCLSRRCRWSLGRRLTWSLSRSRNFRCRRRFRRSRSHCHRGIR